MTDMTMLYVAAAIFALLVIGFCVWVAMPPMARMREIGRSFTRARTERRRSQPWFRPWFAALWHGQPRSSSEC
jgi:hypothetical protein